MYILKSIDTTSSIQNYRKFLKKLFPMMRVVDLLFHVPIKIIDRSKIADIRTARIGDVINIVVEIVALKQVRGKKIFYQVECKSQNTILNLTFFNLSPGIICKLLAVKNSYIVSGKLATKNSICHPDKIVPLEKFISSTKVDVEYALVACITQCYIRSLINKALKDLPDFIEWIDIDTIKQNNWKSWKSSIIDLHQPKDVNAFYQAKARLAYDELLAHQLLLNSLSNTSCNGISIKTSYMFQKEVEGNLGFRPTDEQLEIISQINIKQKSAQRMVALLQGDVGSGKTVIALFAILNVIESGMQASFMVPTSILAEQHAAWIAKVAPKINIGIIKSGMKKSERNQILQELKDNKIQLTIGTHALFEEEIFFNKLALVVIDEQHRFGVLQRLKLINKNKNADILLISATPIPRTLMQVFYGNIECFKLTKYPEGRLPIITSILSKAQVDNILIALKKNDNLKLYWVCPIIEDSEHSTNIASIEHRYEFLFEHFKEKVAMLNGSMKKDEISKIMNKFKKEVISILISTTVIEVGIDVKDANIIIIENAERFGMAQLHQLRGRVGRGNIQSYCILLYGNLSKISYARLKTIRDSQDGFYIAEQDLKLRGHGDIIGKEQSGLNKFIFADIYKDSHILQDVIKLAKDIDAKKNYEKYRQLIDIFANVKYNNSIDYDPFS